MEKHEQSLKRELGLFTGILLVAGLLIGSGVFQKIVPMAQTNLGEVGILLAWVTAGLISLIGAFTIGGLTSLSEASGGIYDYLRISFGKFFHLFTVGLISQLSEQELMRHLPLSSQKL
jgi:basic amino acid/polyamine antiporter, APA family